MIKKTIENEDRTAVFKQDSDNFMPINLTLLIDQFVNYECCGFSVLLNITHTLNHLTKLLDVC